ncbi:MAG: uracil-DNA glycosylase [Bacteroidia bacterium]
MSETVNPQMHESWRQALSGEFSQPYFLQLKNFLQKEKSQGKKIFPPGKLIFSAFNHTPFDKVKVVILGQDPYHGLKQANGLCFSVSDGITAPPSLLNIFKEIRNDLGIPVPHHGNLEKWARQGVLLLNAILTVRAHLAGSHQNRGWESFTDAVIKKISEERAGVVFLLWGKFAQSKKALINEEKHTVLTAPHPSPFSADRGFFGCRHFSRTNKILENQGLEAIDWSL